MENKLENLNRKTLTELLVKMEQKLNGDIVTFYGGINQGVEDIFKDVIETLANDKCKRDRIFVILTTAGGSTIPVERMVAILRHHYKEVNFIVPDYAFSAGTIWCMSGDNIYMNYYSCLGPIDPQVMNKEGKFVAALGYLDKINELIKKADERKLTQAEFMILKDFDLAEIRSYEQAKELSIDLLQQWLTKFKFKDWITHSDGRIVTEADKRKRAAEIGELLSDNNRWKSHARPIGIETLTNELKLKINNFGEDKELNEMIKEYYDSVKEYIRGHGFINFFHTRKFI